MFPFWSPDSRYLAFFANGKLMKVLAGGGPTLTLCNAPSGRGGSWNQDDVILFSPTFDGVIHRVPAAGGEPWPSPPWIPPPATGPTAGQPSCPTAATSSSSPGPADDSENDRDAICVGDPRPARLQATGPGQVEPELRRRAAAVVRDNVLMAQPFDPGRWKPPGTPFPLPKG